MSSSTFSSSQYRRYAIGVLAMAFIPCALFFGVGIYLQPLEGDLTRIGSYAERSYGWLYPQKMFKEIRYTNATYTRGHDMVVLGDSFATAMAHRQWQNQVAAETGLSIVTLSSYTTSLQEILNSPVFAESPPRYLVLTYVERHFPQQIEEHTACNLSEPQPQDSGSLPDPDTRFAVSMPSIADPVVLERQQHWDDWRDVKLGHAAKYVLYGLIRTIFGKEPSKALRVDLRRSDLFSNAHSSSSLVFRGDVDKAAKWKEMGLDRLSCGIETLRKKVEANGRTRFVLMVPPDKLTAYSPWVTNPALQKLSVLAELSKRHRVVMPRLDLALTAAIDAGHPDVYLPNNTHWGISGHLVAARTLVEFMKKR